MGGVCSSEQGLTLAVNQLISVCDTEAKVEAGAKSSTLIHGQPALWNGTIHSPSSLALQVKHVLGPISQSCCVPVFRIIIVSLYLALCPSLELL